MFKQLTGQAVNLIIEIAELNREKLLACNFITTHGIQPDALNLHDGFDGDVNNPAYFEIQFTTATINTVLDELATAGIDADVQIMPPESVEKQGWSYDSNAYVRAGTVHANTKSQDSAAYELQILLKTLNAQGNDSANDCIRSSINALHPHGWIVAS